MTHEESTELQHMKKLFKKLQKLQFSTIGDSALSINLDSGGYLHSMNVYAHVNGADGKTALLEVFRLATFLSYRENEDTCNACIEFVNAHRTLTV